MPTSWRHVLWALLVLGLSLQADSKEEEMTETWATKLGDELWQLGDSVTRVQDIKTSYKRHNARVLPTDGEGILNSIVTNVNKLLKRKMDSVNCVIEAAERLARSYVEDNSTYYYFSSKFSEGPGVNESRSLEESIRLEEEDLDEPDGEVPGVNYSLYKTISLGEDYHFYQNFVNTNISSVHVPTDVYDQGSVVRDGLRWSEGLDEVFRKNYMADPTMSWQYFGSSSGFLRHYPALHWRDINHDVFDCRTRFWYIEAATCTKDVVILVDNSGSMYGMRNTIARLTVNTILDTFSNNDFINIFSFNNTIKNIVSCFPDDMLVQATPENIQMLKEAVNTQLKPDDKADFKQAFEFALNLLNKTRENKTCDDDICNQAIMLVTDGLPDNITDVMEKYNWFNNRTRIPVRVFTYLIGKEVQSKKLIGDLACQNRGYMVHIKDLEEVRSQVLKYISVIARPLVLQAVEHPLSWTHSFVDASTQTRDCFCPTTCNMPDQNFRFMTSVSGPAFDTEGNNIDGSRKADLLGVAGTDVLIDDIKSLTLPYKIGANGYAFVITNNGYVLFHPDLRPVHEKCLKRNYNSVDLTEIEQLDDQIESPRNPSPEILELREAMINSEGGKKMGLKMKFHYDDFKRVGVETRNYYFAPVDMTPFTMGLVLPDNYGDFWIKAGDQILRSKQMRIPLTNYFEGNWRVHPDWVYCDYHRNGNKHFDSAEEKLRHFLEKIFSPDWVWKDRFYHEDLKSESDDESQRCDRPHVDEDASYCDKQLMQLLVFDAKITEGSYKSSKWAAKDRIEEELVMRFNATLRFVATQSGLTRWQTIPDSVESSSSWGDENKRALDEAWYRSAVLHHHLDPEAFVFSVPYDSGWMEDMDDLKVTATHAIFPRDGGHEAPGSVVGFQIAHSALYKRFREITSKCQDCEKSCEDDELDCYIIDGNGYVVISEEKNDTGRFFGDVEGAIMESMITKNIFRPVLIHDYQAICSWETPVASSAIRLLFTPFQMVLSAVQWFIGQILWNILNANFYVTAQLDEDDPWYQDPLTNPNTSAPSTARPLYVYFLNRTKPNITLHLEACDKRGKFYMLQHLSKEGYSSESHVNCSRPFYVKRLPHTNLLLIVVNTLHESCFRVIHNRMEKIDYENPHDVNSTPPCNKLNLNSLPRRPLSGCFNYHPLEQEVIQCGRGNLLKILPPSQLILVSLVSLLLFPLFIN